MKTIRFITQLLITFVLFACTEENVLQQQIVDKGEGIRIIADFADTRTSYEDDGEAIHVTWNIGDQIGIYSESQNNLEYITQTEGKTSSFYAWNEEVEVAQGETVFAYYPYKELSEEGNPEEIRMPSNEMIDPSHMSLADLDFIYAKGVVRDNELFLSFKHVFAFLKITVDVDLLIDNASRGLYIEGSDYISTLDFYDEYSYFDIESETVQGDKINSLYYFIPDEMISTGATEVTCYIPILPQSENATLNIYASDYSSVEFLWSKEVPNGGLKAGSVYNIIIKEKTEYYTSTDYSMDGEYELLQMATEGDGIDLVFMGDAFVDKDMGNNGRYKQCMQDAMECLFGVEPYKTLRNRFNVYMVNVVSPNDVFEENAVHALAGSNDKCFEYASLIKNINKERLMVTVIYNTKNDFFSLQRSYCSMFTDGSFVAHIMESNTLSTFSSTVIHEVGGHGIANLADEYLEYPGSSFSGYESSYDYFESVGWYANVDYDNNPATIKWAHLLDDPLYKDEIGIYEGALWEYGIYRSSRASTMGGEAYGIGGNVSRDWFNAPSREAIYKKVMSFSEGPEWEYDYKEFVEWDAPFRNTMPPYEFFTRNFLMNKKRVYREHRVPVIIEGTWRDVLNKSK